MQPLKTIYIGFDHREVAAFAACRASIERYLSSRIQVRGIILDEVQRLGIYTRPTTWKNAGARRTLYDEISKHSMSTEFAISRFLTPHLARSGWALFMDCDMMAVTNFMRVFDEADDKYAVMCVKHDYQPAEKIKMDWQTQAVYPRKNWSSFMLFNCDHPSNKRLSLDVVNTVPGRDLHRFCWLEDNEIGELQPGWNWLVGEQPQPDPLMNIHWTQGGPWFRGYGDVSHAQDWRDALHAWAR